MSEPVEMELFVAVDGGVKCLYNESLDLRALGKLQITRASHVEPDSDGNWWADMWPVGGPVLGPFGTRGEALAAERGWLGGNETSRGYRLVTWQHPKRAYQSNRSGSPPLD